MSTRRQFIQLSAAVGTGALIRWQLDPTQGWLFNAARVFASVLSPQTPLPGSAIPRFVDPLPTFVGSRVPDTSLTVAMEEFQQQVLPASMYPPSFSAGTWVWGYNVGGSGPKYPGVTVEARRSTPTTITYVNKLPTAVDTTRLSDTNLQKDLTVDQTLHWADPLKQMGSRLPYTGPIPTVVHLHGGEVLSASDGGPDEWFTATGLHGAAYATVSPTAPNAAVYQYPNGQPATTLWFHDHALGITRLNVYAGLAAFYLLRDQYDTGLANNPLGLPAGNQEIELVIQDRQFDTNGQLYFPDGSSTGLNGTPPNPDIHPFWIPEFFGDVIVANGKAWPFLNVEPRRYRFRLLNGSNARFYELRLMNRATEAPGPAFWQIGTDGGLLDKPVQLNDPANPSALRLFLAPAERADIIIDFARFAGQTLTLINSAKAPNPSGAPPDPQTSGQVMQFRVAPGLVTDTTFDPATGASLRGGPGQPPLIVHLTNPTTGGLATGVKPSIKRQLVLVEVEGPGGPIEVLLNNSRFDGLREGSTVPIPGARQSNASIKTQGIWLTELPRVGDTEEWEIINTTADAHPIHVHLIQFQLMNRQAFNRPNYRKLYDSLFPGGTFIPGYGPPGPSGPGTDYTTPNADGALGGNPAVSSFLQNGPLLPEANEVGWKDTIKMFPGQVTRVLLRWAPQDTLVEDVSAGTNKFPFDPTSGPGYMWHCHILDHEDNEMMRPYLPLP